jgi:anthranilate 1,2-dioxygenase large subunit
MAEEQRISQRIDELAWPAEGLTRVPYWVFQDEGLYRSEQRRIFRGPSWHYLALEVELPDPGDFRTTKIGDTPVILTRDSDGEIYGFENRCAHRGALICLDIRGKSKKRFTCVYHAWTYDRQGKLIGVAFKMASRGTVACRTHSVCKTMVPGSCGSRGCTV